MPAVACSSRCKNTPLQSAIAPSPSMPHSDKPPSATSARFGQRHASRGARIGRSPSPGKSRHTQARAESASSATAAKCTAGSAPAPASTLPSAAPHKPPALNAAWNDDMIGRAARCSTSTACAFIATPSEPPAAPNQNKPSTKVGSELANAGSGSAKHSSNATARLTGKLPKRATLIPAIGIATTAPTVDDSRASPSAPFSMPSFTCTSGMREIHDEPVRPDRKKTVTTAARDSASASLFVPNRATDRIMFVPHLVRCAAHATDARAAMSRSRCAPCPSRARRSPDSRTARGRASRANRARLP